LIKKGNVVSRNRTAVAKCEDCEWVSYIGNHHTKRQIIDRARAHAGIYDHIVEIVTTVKQVYSLCDTMKGDNESN
jgi:hypothetical protein